MRVFRSIEVSRCARIKCNYALSHQRVCFDSLHKTNEPMTTHGMRQVPVKVELVKMRTILELTGGKVASDPAKIESTV